MKIQVQKMRCAGGVVAKRSLPRHRVPSTDRLKPQHRNMSKSVAILFCAMLAVAAAQPVFPNDWSDVEQDEAVINQGGVVSPDQSQVLARLSPPLAIDSSLSPSHYRLAFFSRSSAGLLQRQVRPVQGADQLWRRPQLF